MKDFKGTPGPWYWDEEGLGNKNHIVFGKGYPAEMTSKANKDLIAAAPELLGALQRITPLYEALMRDCGLEHKEMIAISRAAINKALGEKQ